jgi:O-antigen ligase
MAWIFAILISALVLKDTAPLGDSYILRGLSEGLALVVGLGWVLLRGPFGLLKRYGLVFAYLGVLALTVFVARRPGFVALQLLSLSAVVLFFIAFVESREGDDEKGRNPSMTVMMAVYGAVCVGSLAVFLVEPALAFDSTVEGQRFRGLFGKPAMMGATAGLLLGLSLFGHASRTLRGLGVLASLPCLYLTGSRTFWAAAGVSLALTGVLYVKRIAMWVGMLAIAALVCALVVLAGDVRFKGETLDQLFRAESLEKLSGRTTIWTKAMEKFRERPYLGFGFTTGGDAYEDKMALQTRALALSDSGHARLFTLHNGYVQALTDSGALGAGLYVAAMAAALWSLLKWDRRRRYGAEFYGLGFLAVANIGETIIFSAAVSYAVFYWYLVVLALSRRRSPGGAAGATEPDGGAVAAGSQTVSAGSRRYPILADRAMW